MRRSPGRPVSSLRLLVESCACCGSDGIARYPISNNNTSSIDIPFNTATTRPYWVPDWGWGWIWSWGLPAAKVRLKLPKLSQLKGAARLTSSSWMFRRASDVLSLRTPLCSRKLVRGGRKIRQWLRVKSTVPANYCECEGTLQPTVAKSKSGNVNRNRNAWAPEVLRIREIENRHR